MSPSKKLMFIHDNRKTHRRWVPLDADTKRAILNLLPDAPDEQTILKAIRRAKRWATETKGIQATTHIQIT
jgi:hypothetical protein